VILIGEIVLSLFWILSIFNTSALAQSAVCIRNVHSPLTLDGVVADGLPTPGCVPEPAVWKLVEPLEFLPGNSSPGGYLYLAYYDPGGPNNRRLFIGIDIANDDDLTDQDVVYILFDATNDGIFNEGDFYIKVPVTSSANALTGTQCDQSTGTAEYYRYVNSGWEFVNTIGVASQIQSKCAYDYDASPGEPPKIWNLEISIPVGLNVGGTNYFGLQTSGNFFGIGAYVFVDNGHHQAPQLGTVLKWPESMVDRGITDQDMGFPASLATQLGDASLTDICFDVNFSVASPLMINGGAAHQGGTGLIQRTPDGTGHANNIFRVTFYFDGPGDVATAMTNQGTVEIWLTPFRSSGWTGYGSQTWKMTQSVDAGQFNHEKTVDFTFDFAHPPQDWVNWETANGQADLVCADLFLEGFQYDQNNSNNSSHHNNNTFATSTSVFHFFMSAGGLPNLKRGESTTLFLRMQSTNDEEVTKKEGQGGLLQFLDLEWPNSYSIVLTLGLLSAGLLIVLILAKLQHATTMKRYIGAFTMLTIVIMCYQISCICIRPTPPQIETSRFRLKNSDSLGIKAVKGENNLYEMPIKYGEIKRAEIEVTGRPLPYQAVKNDFKPATEKGDPNILRLPVKPGEVVTIIAFGKIDLDGLNGRKVPTSPTGFVDSATVLQKDYLLKEGYYSPNEHDGALIGSFNNFETSFVIGSSLSIIVPSNATTLGLAVNAIRGKYKLITGAYEIFTINTPGPCVPTHTRINGDATYQIPYTLNPWEVLSSLNVYTYYQTVEVGPGGGVRSRTFYPWGFAHFSVYDSHILKE
jgi:hypothetical protein